MAPNTKFPTHSGYFEQTIRNLSGDNTFAIPYWDWTTLPQIPDCMFDGVLTPQNTAFEPYTGNLALFTSLLKQPLTSHWNKLDAAQRAQLNVRGYTDLETMWDDVTGYLRPQKYAISANMCYAITCGSRYLSADNPKLDKDTAYDVSPFVVYSGLQATDFYNPENNSGIDNLSFTSSKTTSHNSQPGTFSVLEGLPHNKVHNCIGGVGPLNPGPYGNMTNFLSPIDPIFFLHHANMDRLWDVWTRKQKQLNLPYLPTGQDLQTFSNEQFLFFVNGKGEYVGSSQAGEYFSMDRFEYDYEPGFGEKVVQPPAGAELIQKSTMLSLRGAIKGNSASFSIPAAAIKSNLAAALGASLIAQVTLPLPGAMSSGREFDVLVGAPPGVTQGGANSPYYAGTIAFFGNMMHMAGCRLTRPSPCLCQRR
jgi:tyrosinase